MVKNIVLALGALLVVIGILGFVPVLAPEGQLFGIFNVNTVHNIGCIAFGIIAIAMAARGGRSGAILLSKIFGITYALFTLLGFVLPEGDLFGIMTAALPDNILHALFAVIFLGLGFGVKTPRRPDSIEREPAASEGIL